jgi:hypothetical protein
MITPGEALDPNVGFRKNCRRRVREAARSGSSHAALRHIGVEPWGIKAVRRPGK